MQIQSNRSQTNVPDVIAAIPGVVSVKTERLELKEARENALRAQQEHVSLENKTRGKRMELNTLTGQGAPEKKIARIRNELSELEQDVIGAELLLKELEAAYAIERNTVFVLRQRCPDCGRYRTHTSKIKRVTDVKAKQKNPKLPDFEIITYVGEILLDECCTTRARKVVAESRDWATRYESEIKSEQIAFDTNKSDRAKLEKDPNKRVAILEHRFKPNGWKRQESQTLTRLADALHLKITMKQIPDANEINFRGLQI